jgi:hypothetical protein
VIGVIILVIALFGFFLKGPNQGSWVCENGQWVSRGNPNSLIPNQPCGNNIGGQKDEHGCLIAAGYKWCASQNKCLKAWEEYCQEYKDEYQGKDKVIVSSPKSATVISSPLEVDGQARGPWYFEAQFPVKIEDEKGNILGQATAQAQGDWMTDDFVPFKALVNFDPKNNNTGFLVLEKDNPSGLPENAESIKIPVVFKTGTTKIKVYFGKYGPDSSMEACEKVYPVEREVAKTESIGKTAIEQLLAGLTETDKKNGFYTSINPNVKVKSLVIKDGTAKVDFDQQMERGVGGSCRVIAIRSQITQTLKQFPTVQNVIISVEGRTEDALQP